MYIFIKFFKPKRWLNSGGWGITAWWNIYRCTPHERNTTLMVYMGVGICLVIQYITILFLFEERKNEWMPTVKCSNQRLDQTSDSSKLDSDSSTLSVTERNLNGPHTR